MAQRRKRTAFCSTEPAAVDVPLWKEGVAVLEWLRLRGSEVYGGEEVPRGDGSPVIVIPGFLCSDLHLTSMRRWLKRIGYRPYKSGIGMNSGCPGDMGLSLLRRLEQVTRETHRRPHLVGHSLGGLLARSLAAQRPDAVASVVTLGSPVRELRSHSLVLLASRVLSTMRRLTSDAPPGCMTPACECPTVRAADDFPGWMPVTSVYTREDGVVDWESCASGDPGVDVEVGGTHLGLMYNPDAYAAIARHLARSLESVKAAA